MIGNSRCRVTYVQFSHCGSNFFGNGYCPVQIGSRKNDGKLFPSIAGWKISRSACTACKGFGDSPKTGIALGMAIIVVVFFEKVDVG